MCWRVIPWRGIKVWPITSPSGSGVTCARRSQTDVILHIIPHWRSSFPFNCRVILHFLNFYSTFQLSRVVICEESVTWLWCKFVIQDRVAGHRLTAAKTFAEFLMSEVVQSWHMKAVLGETCCRSSLATFSTCGTIHYIVIANGIFNWIHKLVWPKLRNLINEDAVLSFPV